MTRHDDTIRFRSRRTSLGLTLVAAATLWLAAGPARSAVIIRARCTVRPTPRPVLVVRPAPRPVVVVKTRPARRVWVPGHWARRPGHRLVWVPGHWRRV